MKLLLSFVARALSGCTAWTPACYTTSQRSNAQCLSIVSAVFIDIQAPAGESGGALKAEVSSTIDISGCSFVRCTADTGSGTFGGACYFYSGSQITIADTCGNECSAGFGQFVYMTSDQLNGHFLNLTGLLTCGTDTGDGIRGVYIDSIISAVDNVNFTNCMGEGSVIGAQPGTIVGNYLTVVGCSGHTMFWLTWGYTRSTIKYSNFVDNSLREDGTSC
jgi:hypothetical protein